MTRLELTELVGKAQSGDDKALEEIYSFTRPHIYNMAYSALKNENDAEDIVQDCYVAVISKLGELKTPESFEKWLNTIAANKIKDYVKRKKPDLIGDDNYDFVADIPEKSSEYIPHEKLEREDNGETVTKIVGELSEDKRKCIEMHYYDEKSVSEIAKELNVPENTVKSRLHQGRKEVGEKIRKRSSKLLITIFVLILLIVCALSVSASRKVIFNFIDKVCESFISIIVPDPVITNEPLSVVYHMTYVPEGYKMSETFVDAQHYCEYYRSETGGLVSFQQMPVSSRMTVDNSDATNYDLEVGNLEIMVTRNDDAVHLVWADEESLYLMFSAPPLSDEEMIKIVEGLEPRE